MQRAVLLLVAVACVCTPLSAQAPVTGEREVAAAAAYDAGALWVERGRILRGRNAERVGQLGWLSATRVAPLMGASDSAQHYAAEFDRHYTPGVRWNAVGGLGAGIVAVFLLERGDGVKETVDAGDWVMLGGLAVSIVVGDYGARRIRRARHALVRAIWWHNREFAIQH